MLVAVDVVAGTVVARVAIPAPAHNVTVASDGRVAATTQSAGSVVVVGADGAPFVARVGGSPHDVKPTDDGFVVANAAGRRLDVLGQTGSPAGTVALPGSPHDLTVVGGTVWVTLDDSDRVLVVDLARRAVAREVATGRRAHDLLAGSDDRVWVTDLDGGLFPVEGDEVGAPVAIGREAHHLAFAVGSGELWVSDSPGRALTVVDAVGGTAVDTIRLEGSPHHLAAVAGRVAVADNTNGRLLVFDERTRQQVASVAVGPRPHGAAVAPQG